MNEISDLTKKINRFVKKRNWEKFQKPKDLAISLVLEASELLEHFQWKGDKAAREHVAKNKTEVADEIADVAVYLFKLADKININLASAIESKLIKAAKKYPVKKVKEDSKLNNYKKIKQVFRQNKK